MDNLINSPSLADLQTPTGPKTPQGKDATNPNPQNHLTEREKNLQECLKYIDNLVEFGIFTEEKGSQIKENLMKSASGAPDESKSPVNSVFITSDPAEMSQASEFFTTRQSLKTYLEGAGLKLDSEEFSKIAKLVKELETAAIARFSESQAHGELLREFNEMAKNRLQTHSSTLEGGKDLGIKQFTPEEIGKMSSSEFLANEKAINEQIAGRRG